MKILFTGGGTAGHIFPIIAIIREIKRIDHLKNFQFFYLGPKDAFSENLLSKEGIKVKTILTGKIRRYFGLKTIFQNLFDIIFKIPIGIFQSFIYIFFLAPDLIFSKGGFGSLPVGISGWIFQIPIFLHESDASPGLANRFLSWFSVEIFISFSIKETGYFPIKKMISVGNPIRKEILEGKREEAKNFLKLIEGKPIILILGGSQGSQRINDLLLQILPEMLADFEVIHQCGEKNFKEVQAEANVVIGEELKKYYHLFPFLGEEELKQAYVVSDLIISRAGSGSIFEIATYQKPAILIPLPEAAQNHQIKNAYIYAEKGACLVIEETNLTPHFFLERIKYLLSQTEKLKKMKEAAKKFSRPRAAKIIAEYLIEYLTK